MKVMLSLILFYGLGWTHLASGQTVFLGKLKANLDYHLRRYPVEKVYLHLDRTSYMTGETMYFTVYTSEGYLHKPSTISSNIYVEFFSGENKLLKRTVILVKGGQGSGHINLSDTIKTGFYRIRAYSNWMQNFDHRFFFLKDIPIFSLYENQQSPRAPSSPVIADFQFFPEGGDLIYGVESKVAFKAVDANGRGIDVEGKVFDEQHNEIANLKSSHLGTGLILLRPESNHTYHAVVDGLTPVALPVPKVSGYALKVINNPTLKNINFEVRTNNFAPDSEVTAVVQCRGRLLYSGNFKIASGGLNGAIPRLAFLSGVNHITIFDKNGFQVAERLFYVNREDTLRVTAVPSDTVLGRRKRIAIDIFVQEKEGRPAKARLSVATTDDSQFKVDGNRETVTSYLLLSSDIRGTVESPGYYFSPSNKDRWEALDLLMLTQGWRRFVWRNILEKEQTAQFVAENGFHITGTMRRPYSNKPVPAGKVSFLSKDFKTIFGAIETDANGRFRVPDIQVTGSSEILFQGEYKKKRTDVWFDFDTLQVIPNPQYQVCPPLELEDIDQAFIGKGIERRNIDERFNVGKGETLLDEVVILGEKIPATIRENLQAKSPGYKKTIKIENASWATHPFQLLRGHPTGLGECNRPIRVFWNGVEIISPSQLNGMDPNLVSEIDTACDLVAFWTRPGSYSKSATSFMLRGYQPSREFYSPKYNIQLSEHEKEDYRVTLDWQPEIQTDEMGRAHIEFYTSDNVTAVSVNIEGISSTGIPLVYQTKFRITDQ